MENLKLEFNINHYIDYINNPINRDKTFELMDGQIVMSGGASSNHHRISGYIFNKIYNFLESKQCEVFQDINFYLFKDSIENCHNVFQPDIIIGCDKSKMTNKGYEGIPEFVVEVVSKSTAQYDYSFKCSRYMRFGVKEYWIVDSYADQILVYTNTDLVKIKRYTFEDVITLHTFDGLSIDFSEILKLIGE